MFTSQFMKMMIIDVLHGLKQIMQNSEEPEQSPRLTRTHTHTHTDSAGGHSWEPQLPA